MRKTSGKKVVKKVKAKAKLTATENLVKIIIDGIQDRKGENVVSLDLRTLKGSVCDFFIICQGNSRTQVDAIADSIHENVKKKLGERPYHNEGFGNAEWIIMDYVTVVVHIFQPENRRFYNIEGLWADAEIMRHA